MEAEAAKLSDHRKSVVGPDSQSTFSQASLALGQTEIGRLCTIGTCIRSTGVYVLKPLNIQTKTYHVPQHLSVSLIYLVDSGGLQWNGIRFSSRNSSTSWGSSPTTSIAYMPGRHSPARGEISSQRARKSSNKVVLRRFPASHGGSTAF